ncbi:MAG: hypothetical protein R2939_17065 [Kofleriaceae bacterium]
MVGTYEPPMAISLPQLPGRRPRRLVPMAVEEPSIVAAASNAARMACASGGFVTSSSAPIMDRADPVVHVDDPDAAVAAIEGARPALLAQARARAPRPVERGGGPVELHARILARPPGPDGGVVVVHLHVDCRDAMGANLVNTPEQLGGAVAELARGQLGLRILTNLTDERTVTVGARVLVVALDDGGDATTGLAIAHAIAAASRFAAFDRRPSAATHK